MDVVEGPGAWQAGEHALRQLHAVARGLNGDLDLGRTLTAVCRGVVDGLGFGVAVVNLVRPDGDLEVVAVAGSRSAHDALFGTSASGAEWEALLAVCTPVGEVLVGYDHDQHPVAVTAWVPDTPVSDDPGAWHPLDEVFAPLRTCSSGLLGVISVDLPRDGRRPCRAQLELLEMYAAQACVAIENARLHTTQAELVGRLSALLTEAPVAILELDLDGLVVDWNPEAERIFGWTRKEVLGRPNPTLDTQQFRASLAELERSGAVHRQQVRRRRKDGSLVDVEMSSRIVRDGEGRPFGYIGTLVDVSGRVALERRLRVAAQTDPLTGLANRALLLERVDQARREPQPAWLLLLDLDGFKAVNDGHGHEVGDALLQDVAGRLRKACRPTDLAARLGGDEFVVLLHGDHEAAVALGERLLQVLSATYSVRGRNLTIGCSIGIAPVTATEAGEALRDADIAMYTAKSAGRGCVRSYHPALGAAALDRADLAEDLRSAIPRGQLALRWHPLVNTRTRGVVGIEALVRWQHPERGELAPGQFLHLAEETGVVVPLGEWVLHEACRQVRRWQQEVPGCERLVVSVNLSPVQLRDPAVVEHVRSALSSSGLAPDRLVLEITEDVLMEDLDSVVEVLHRLKALGLRLAMDDFGAGYSSLRYLRRLPVDVVKLDRGLVEGVDTDADARSMVEAMLALVATLGLSAVAEGVETVPQLEVLGELGCPLVQGFLVSKPLSPQDIGAMLSVGWPCSSVQPAAGARPAPPRPAQ